MVIAGRVDHIAIAAENTLAMAQWYEKVLGLVIHVEAGPLPPATQKVYMVGPPLATGASPEGLHQGSMIEIMARNDSPKHARNSHEPGLSHIAWHVKDFDSALARLREHNVKLLGEPFAAIGGGRIVSFEDNEGNMMQIIQR